MAAEEDFRLLVESASDLILILKDRKVAYANKAALRTLGYEASELLGMSADRIAYPDDRAGVRERWAQLEASGGTLPSQERRLLRRDGTTLWIDGSAYASRLGGEPALVLLGRDLSDRRRAAIERELSELALKKSEETFRGLTENLPVAVCVFRDDQVLYANPAAVCLLGYASVEDLMAVAMSDTAHPAEREESRARARRVMETGAINTVERRAVRKDGQTLIVEVTALRIDFQGAPALLTIGHDLTTRRAAEARGLALQRQLAVTERLAAMGQLVGAVAHEVRNPLFAMSATVDGLEAVFGDRPQAHAFLSVFRDQVSRLSRLMADLLAYGRPVAFHRQERDIEDVLSAGLKPCAALASERRIALSTSVEPALAKVEVDADRVAQVVQNLVTNALQLAPRETSVEVSARPKAEHGVAGVTLAVRDRGPGFAPEDLPHVFDPFFSRRPDGVGLGLAIVREIVSQHGGTVKAANRLGGGAEVEVWLPERA